MFNVPKKTYKCIYLLFLGINPRLEPTLLLHCHQLSQERVGAEDVVESAQEIVGGRTQVGRLQQTLQLKRDHCERDA